MATRSLLGLITALSLRILLECFLVIHFSAKIVINSRLTHRDPPLFTNLNVVTLLNSPSVVQFFGGEVGWDGVISWKKLQKLVIKTNLTPWTNQKDSIVSYVNHVDTQWPIKLLDTIACMSDISLIIIRFIRVTIVSKATEHLLFLNTVTSPINFGHTLCNVHWTFRSLPQVSWTHVLISNSWQAWLGIVDQNWLKLALAKLALGQPISLKVVGMPTSIKTTVRSKLPFIYMKYLTYPANSTRNPIP